MLVIFISTNLYKQICAYKILKPTCLHYRTCISISLFAYDFVAAINFSSFSMYGFIINIFVTKLRGAGAILYSIISGKNGKLQLPLAVA